MQEDITPQEGMSPESEVIEETEQFEEEQEETVPKGQFNQVLARAKKAEEDNRKLRESATVAPKPITQSSVSERDVEIKILKSKGISEELITEMVALAEVRKVSVLDVENDPIYLAMKETREKDEQAKKARLPASRGSGTVKKEIEITSPGLTDEQHKEIWRKNTGR